MQLKGSVGAKKPNGLKSENYSGDVAFVQTLLNYFIMFDPTMKHHVRKTLVASGFGPLDDTIVAIQAFQLFVLNGRATGRIDRNDATFKALTGKVVGIMPRAEAIAPLGTRARNRITKLLHDDMLSSYIGTPNLQVGREVGEWRLEDSAKKCILEKLLRDDVDDAYLSEADVASYIGAIAGGSLKESHALSRLGSGSSRSNEKFAESVNALFSDIQKGIQKLNIAIAGETGAHRRTATGELTPLYRRTETVRDWIMQRSESSKSIYSCLGVTEIKTTFWE